jgi:transposase InsO family protein
VQCRVLEVSVAGYHEHVVRRASDGQRRRHLSDDALLMHIKVTHAETRGGYGWPRIYIATDEGWLFLAVMIDLFSRQVVGWSLRENMSRDIAIDALRMAWFKRQPE